jgi:calcium-binding protein CML
MTSGGKSYFSESVPEVVVQSLFRKYDTDGSGRLQSAELMKLLNDLGMDPKQAETVMMLVDKDGSGTVSFEEFFQWLREGEGLRNVDDSTRYYYLRKAVDLFKKYDKDASGTIEPNELEELLKSIGYTGSMESALKTLDKDGNNKISFSEFLQWLNWIPTK